MPFSHVPHREDLCQACRELAPDRRGHTFLEPQRRDGAAGYFSCMECGALWFPTDGPAGRRWNLVRIEAPDARPD
jgi:hypothetical protein